MSPEIRPEVGRPLLTNERYLAAIRDAGEATWRLAEGHFDVRVPTCPEWRLRDLVHHLGNIAYFMRACLDAGGPEPEFTDAELPGDPELIGWAAGEWTQVIGQLAAADPDGPAWNWSISPHVASFWSRCLLHEATVHAWDAATAVGGSLPIPPDVAVDGVDEILAVHLPSGAHGGRAFTLPGPIEVHSTDTGHRWLVETTPSSVRVSAVAGAAVAGTLSGTSTELYLELWDRARVPRDAEQRRWVRQLLASGG